MAKPRTSGPVRSVARAVDLLSCLSEADGAELSLDELCAAAALARSTAHRLLETLVESGLVEHCSAKGRYRLGPHAVVLGAAAARAQTPRAEVRGVLERVVRQTGATSGLAMISARLAITVGRVVSSGDGEPPLASRIRPAHASAAGKLLLANLPRTQVERRFADVSELPRYTARTITLIPDLFAELDRTRACGFALDDEEYREGLRCVAVPVYSRKDRATHCIGISWTPSSSFKDPYERVLPLLNAAAARLAGIL